MVYDGTPGGLEMDADRVTEGEKLSPVLGGGDA